MKTVIPIFFSVNDAYSPFLATAICSIKANASRSYTYHIHILTDDVSVENKDRLSALAEEGFIIEFNPLAEQMAILPGVKQLQSHCFDAFATLTIYFRLFIPELFPQYDKVIYLDADLVVPGDISELYQEHLGTKLVGAVADYSIQKIAPFMRYIDRYVGVDHQNYVNSGVLLLNCKRLREVDLAGRFLNVLKLGLVVHEIVDRESLRFKRIFIVVMLTFRSIIIPLILVLVIQGAVYLTMTSMAIVNYDMVYLALLIMQCILMGATIDYAIVFTNYYREKREKKDIKEALADTYQSSIRTIATSSLIMICATAIVGFTYKDQTISPICRIISLGVISSIILILVFLPSILAIFDKWIIKKK